MSKKHEAVALPVETVVETVVETAVETAVETVVETAVETAVETTEPGYIQQQLAKLDTADLARLLELLNKKPKSSNVKKTVKTGVGAEILVHIARGVLSNKEIVEAVLKADARRKTTYACVAWYKSKVSKGEIDLPVLENEADLTDLES